MLEAARLSFPGAKVPGEEFEVGLVEDGADRFSVFVAHHLVVGVNVGVVHLRISQFSVHVFVEVPVNLGGVYNLESSQLKPFLIIDRSDLKLVNFALFLLLFLSSLYLFLLRIQNLV